MAEGTRGLLRGAGVHAGIPLIMETPVQEKGPAVDYKQSLAAGAVVRRQGKNDDPGTPECTDTRDIRLLYSLCR